MPETPAGRQWVSLPEALAVAGVGEAQLRQALIAGDVYIRARKDNGTTEEIPPADLVTADIDWAGSRATAWSAWIVDAPVEVDKRSVLDCFGAAKPPRKVGGGRPAKWDWEAFWCELTGIVHEEGLPPVQARLVERMARWFTEHDADGDHPELGEIKKRVSKLYRRLRGEN